MPPKKKTSKPKPKARSTIVIKKSKREDSTFQTPANDQLFTFIEPYCPNGRNHSTGRFCHVCRGIMMPWGVRLPIYRKDNGEDVTTGPPKSLLEGVNLRNETELGVVSVLTDLLLAGKAIIVVDDLDKLVKIHVNATTAAHRIVALIKDLKSVSKHGDKIPPFDSIIHEALKNPFQTSAEHYARIKKTFALGDEVPNTRSNVKVGAAGPSGFDARDVTDSEMSESEEEEEAEDDNNEEDEADFEDDSEDDSEDSDGFIMKSRVERTQNEHHVPPEAGDWVPEPGCNLDDPVLNMPDTSKFFIIRHLRDNPSKKDVREYPLWRSFDWSNLAQITSLKKHRNQIRIRTHGLISVRRAGWTLAEKEALKNLVIQELAKGFTRKTLDWTAITDGLAEHFKNVVQKKGSRMAETDKLTRDNKIIKTGKANSFMKDLKYDRVGWTPRTPGIVKGASKKYADIKMLIDMAKEKEPEVEAEGSASEGEDDTTSESDEGPQRKRNRHNSASSLPVLDVGSVSDGSGGVACR